MEALGKESIVKDVACAVYYLQRALSKRDQHTIIIVAEGWRRSIEWAQKETICPWSNISKGNQEFLLRREVQHIGHHFYLGTEGFLQMMNSPFATRIPCPPRFDPKVIITLNSLDARVGKPLRSLTEKGITHLNLAIKDDDELKEALPRIMALCYRAILDNQQVYMHCSKGEDLSPRAWVLCLREMTGESEDRIWHLLRFIRPQILT